jgi:SAM-dependent methyltransferase
VARKRRGRPAAPGARARDRQLEAGRAAHYEDPAYYAKTYKRRLEDVRYYVDLAAERGGPVLEYGCGNGRITLPLARAGVEVVGVDLSAPMLADLRRRLEGESEDVRDRIDARQGDMRSVLLRRRFPLVIVPFNAFLHLYGREDVERFLACARKHLARGGELVFDVSIPEPSELARDPKKAHFAPRFRYPDEGGGTMVRYSERFDYDRLRQVLFVAMEFHPLDGGEPWMTPLAHRQFFPQELEALLHYNGFAITEQYGSFGGDPPSQESRTLILHAKARAR